MENKSILEKLEKKRVLVLHSPQSLRIELVYHMHVLVASCNKK